MTRRRPPARGPSSRPVDSQKRKVYAAEGEAFVGYSTPTIGPANRPDLRSVTACDIWVNRQLRRKRLRAALLALGVQIPSRVHINPTGHSAGGGSATINAGKFIRTEKYLLHELAHVLNDYAGGWRNKSGHGREYARIYLLLVRHVLGTFWERRLRQAFRKHKVKYLPKREYTPEQRAALSARLAAVRHKMVAANPRFMGDDDYLEHVASKNDGAISLDDPRAMNIIVRQQDEKIAALRRNLDAARTLSET